jgi:hypothetical protein
VGCGDGEVVVRGGNTGDVDGHAHARLIVTPLLIRPSRGHLAGTKEERYWHKHSIILKRIRIKTMRRDRESGCMVADVDGAVNTTPSTVLLLQNLPDDTAKRCGLPKAVKRQWWPLLGGCFFVVGNSVQLHVADSNQLALHWSMRTFKFCQPWRQGTQK